MDDGVRLWIDGVRVLDEWRAQSETTFSTTMPLQAGRSYTIQMNYYENGNRAAAALEWKSPSQAREIIPPTQLFPLTPGVNTPPNTPALTQPSEDGRVIDPALNFMVTTDFFSDPDTDRRIFPRTGKSGRRRPRTSYGFLKAPQAQGCSPIF